MHALGATADLGAGGDRRSGRGAAPYGEDKTSAAAPQRRPLVGVPSFRRIVPFSPGNARRCGRKMAGDQRSPLRRGWGVGTRRERPFAPDRSADGLSRAPAPTKEDGTSARDDARPPLPKGGCPSSQTGAGGYGLRSSNSIPQSRSQARATAPGRATARAGDGRSPLRLWFARFRGFRGVVFYVCIKALFILYK